MEAALANVSLLIRDVRLSLAFAAGKETRTLDATDVRAWGTEGGEISAGVSAQPPLSNTPLRINIAPVKRLRERSNMGSPNGKVRRIEIFSGGERTSVARNR